MKKVSLEQRFWAKVRKTDRCWIWLAQIDNKGFGRIQVDNAPQRAHRVSYALTHGLIKESIVIVQSCGNKSCVNPEHLVATEGHTDFSKDQLTHCPKGHPFDDLFLISKNSYNGAIRCKQCRDERRI